MKRMVFCFLVIVAVSGSIASASDTIPLEVTHTTYVDALRIRETPRIDGKQIGLIKKGEKVTKIDEICFFYGHHDVNIGGLDYLDAWAKVRTESGIEGYAFAPYMMHEIKYKNFLIQVFENKILIYDNNQIIFNNKIAMKYENHWRHQIFSGGLSAILVKETDCIVINIEKYHSSLESGILFLNEKTKKILYYETDFQTFGFFGFSESKKYLGFLAGGGVIIIFSVEKNDVVFECYSHYIINKWDSNRLELWLSRGNEVKGKPILDKDSYYIEKVYWEDEKLTPTGEYLTGHSQN